MPLTCKLDQADRDKLIQAYKDSDYNSTLLCDYIVHYPEEFGLPEGFIVAPRTVMYYMNRLCPKSTRATENVAPDECSVGQQLQIGFVRFQFTYDCENHPRDFFAFEAIYPWSHKISYTVCPDGTQTSWLKAIARCFKQYGITKEIVCDNDNSLVTAVSEIGEVIYTQEFLWFCRQYGIDPKAVKHVRSQSQGLVQAASKFLKKSGLPWIKMNKIVVNNIEELDAAIQRFTAEYADARIFSAKDGDTAYKNKSVSELFEIESQHLAKFDPDLDINISSKAVTVDKHNLIYIHGISVQIPDGYERSKVWVMVSVYGSYLVTSNNLEVLASGTIPTDNLFKYQLDEKPQ